MNPKIPKPPNNTFRFFPAGNHSGRSTERIDDRSTNVRSPFMKHTCLESLTSKKAPVKTRSIIAAAILTTVLLALAMPVGAVTRIWLGETALWSNPDNWSPNGVPQNGDFLTFPDGGNPFTVRSMNNDL